MSFRGSKKKDGWPKNKKVSGENQESKMAGDNKIVDSDEDIQIGVVRKYSDPSLSFLKKAERERAIRNKNEQYSDTDTFLSSVATEINYRTFSIKQQIVEVGGLLCLAKEKLSAEESFMIWVKDTLPQISHSSALNYMRAYRVCTAAPQLVNALKPSVLYKVETKVFSDQFRKGLKEVAKDPNFADNKELHKFIADVANGKLDLTETELQDEFKQLTIKQHEGQEEKRYREELIGLKRDLNKRLQVIKELNSQGRLIPGLSGSENNVSSKYFRIEEKLEQYIKDITHILDNLHHNV